MPYDITYIWNLEYDTDEPICATETDSWIQKTDIVVVKGEGRWKELSGRLGLAEVSYYNVEWVNTKVLRCNTEN